MSAIADLLDINVWIALSVERHPQHKPALQAWTELRRPTFCRLTQLGFLRLLCNPHVMGGAAFQPKAAWEMYEELTRDGAVGFADEPIGLDVRMRQLTHGGKWSRDFWTDAYMAAFARCAGMRLVSFDGGFSRYSDLLFLPLKPA